MAGDALSAGTWTLISRVTGLIRVTVVASILGPTFLSNIFQSTTVIPALIDQTLAGPILAGVIMPPMVARLDAGDHDGAAAVGGSALGLVLVTFSAASLVVLALGPLIVTALTAGTPEPLRPDARDASWLLLIAVIPQVPLYGLIGIAIATQQARGSFAFPAAAQIFENVIAISVLITAAIMFGPGPTLGSTDAGFLLLIGVGTTTAVALHAAIQWGAARRQGITLRPRLTLHDPETRALIRVGVPSIGTTSLGTIRTVALLIFTGFVPGGVVAMQLGQRFALLPVALAARPVSQALLPRMARLANRGDPRMLSEYRHAVGVTLWVAIPAALGLIALSGPIASVVARGEMASDEGVILIRYGVAAWATTVVGMSVSQLARQAAYARRDARGPLLVSAFRVVVTVPAFIIITWHVDDSSAILLLGLATGVVDMAAAGLIDRRVQRGMLGSGTDALIQWLARDIVAGAIAAGAAWLVAQAVPAGTGTAVIAMLAGAVVGLFVYLGLRSRLGSPELAGFDQSGVLRIASVRAILAGSRRLGRRRSAGNS